MTVMQAQLTSLVAIVEQLSIKGGRGDNQQQLALTGGQPSMFAASVSGSSDDMNCVETIVNEQNKTLAFYYPILCHTPVLTGNPGQYQNPFSFFSPTLNDNFCMEEDVKRKTFLSIETMGEKKLKDGQKGNIVNNCKLYGS